MSKLLKIIFLGTPSFVDPVIKALEENFDVVAKIRKSQKFDVKTIEQLKSLHPDFFVVAAFGQILPAEVLKIPKFGAINIHPSLLPKYRGPSPIQSAILAGETKTGVTLIKMDEEVDHGAIIKQFEEEILEGDTFESLARRLFAKSADVIVPLMTLHGAWKLKPQDDKKATFTKPLTRDDGHIDTTNPPSLPVLDRMIRAYFPWPGVFTKYQISNSKHQIIKLLPDKKIQVEGKRPMGLTDFKNGYEKGEEFLKKLGLS